MIIFYKLMWHWSSITLAEKTHAMSAFALHKLMSLPFGTQAASGPIVLALDGGCVGNFRWNMKYSEKTCPSATSCSYINFSPLGTTAPVGLGLPPWNSPFHFGFFLNLRQSIGLLGRVISSSQGFYLYTNTEKRTHTNTKHPCPECYSNPRSRFPSERRQCIP
jgi:hypothetical protein